VTPGGVGFFGVSFRGDLVGWHDFITSQLKAMGLQHAIIDGMDFVQSDGTSHAICDCQVSLLE